MTEIKINVTLNGDIDLEKIAKAIRKEIECVGFKIEIAETKVEPLKVGDYAKVVDGKGSCFTLGDILEITDDDGRHFSAIRLSDGYDLYADKQGELVRATDEEVAEAKAKAKFAKIGRKPNEFKEGDIAKLTYTAGNTAFYGEIGGINSYFKKEIRYFFVQSNGDKSTERIESLTLITPVEARFDV